VSSETFDAVTPATSGDLERFSAAHGTFRWCSCMRWRLRSAPFRDAGKDGRVAALAERVRRAEPVGVLACADGEVVGWCSVAPRESYAVPVPDGARPVMRTPVVPR
jgi:hypothetical protein